IVTDRLFGPVTVEGNIFRYDAQGRRSGVMVIGAVTARIGCYAYASSLGGGGTPLPPDPFPAQARAALALPEVAEVMTLFAGLTDDNWPQQAYKVWELVREDVGKAFAKPGSSAFLKIGQSQIVNMGWLTQAEASSLKSVHYQSIVGPSARHAVQEQPPPPTVVRTRAEIMPVLRKMLKRWIQHKNSLPTSATPCP
ncbi:MAG: hypothetical protein QM692_16865, partial [Thermomicrobiales bacterium]